jgi:hypothetical protein
MRFAVEAWAPEYGGSVDGDDLAPSQAQVDLTCEVPLAQWAPLRPKDGTEAAATVLFTDGVRRIDARVWIEGDDGQTHIGVCASYAAGVIRCDGTKAEVVACEVQRGLFSSAPGARPIETRHATFPVRMAVVDSYGDLALAVQQRMGALEVELALVAGDDADLIVVDGPLTGRQDVPGAIGFVKTHRVGYLPLAQQPVVAALAAGERTPLFLISGRWSRWSWYLRLPGPVGHPWAGVVRCEATGDLETPAAVRLADTVSCTLPRFASSGHKDPRAPQNLYPIAGLERQLRRRLGDPLLLYRSLRRAAA